MFFENTSKWNNSSIINPWITGLTTNRGTYFAFSFLILSWAVSDEFTAPFGIFGLTLTVMLVNGLIQRFYLNNLTNLLIRHCERKWLGGSHTSQIAALGYVSDTNYIVAFWYLAPITAFRNSFLVHDVRESGGRAQRMTLTRNIGLI